MRRFWLFGLACAMLAPVAGSAQNLPPHAWLFGTWSGGMFPPIAGLSPQACFSQPVVIFTRDLVVRATLTEQTLAQRVVETARSSSGGVEFRFAVTGAAAVPLARRCLAWAATAAGLAIARTPAEMPPENRWVCSTHRGVGRLVAAPDGAAAASMATIVARANKMTRVRFTDMLLEPKEDRPITVGVGGARAPATPTVWRTPS